MAGSSVSPPQKKQRKGEEWMEEGDDMWGFNVVEREDYSRDILVYTVIRPPACGSKVIEYVENGMFESSNELYWHHSE